MDAQRETWFWDKVHKTDGCWLWTGARWSSRHGGPGDYGEFKVAPGRPASAHRVAYELVRGPIPEGLTIDHLCFNKLCVKPEHLEAVSSAENTRRAWARRREMASK
jgi:hypothetical protein